MKTKQNTHWTVLVPDAHVHVHVHTVYMYMYMYLAKSMSGVIKVQYLTSRAVHVNLLLFALHVKYVFVRLCCNSTLQSMSCWHFYSHQCSRNLKKCTSHSGRQSVSFFFFSFALREILLKFISNSIMKSRHKNLKNIYKQDVLHPWKMEDLTGSHC